MALKSRKRPDADTITKVALNTSSNTNTVVSPQNSRAVDALETARSVNPRLPPAEVVPEDKSVNHNMRLKTSTLKSLGKAAAEQGMSVKQLIMKAVADKGIVVAPSDLENGKITPWRER
ncbi:hypothetical protein [Neokomagataea thailandica]|uniref:Uncharacterized protein n=1 Tax=Neokomagataea tanensis NBRC 106556 TaxID=1223519 RepID=A0ABQ0QL59_9PROT|nr:MULTISPECIES: hypothetical protein [Neokomagataea]GBR48789.1 hypothetical protein AA106556_1886 [Neokomagataea tanensis NBRC 106556]